MLGLAPAGFMEFRLCHPGPYFQRLPVLGLLPVAVATWARASWSLFLLARPRVSHTADLLEGGVFAASPLVSRPFVPLGFRSLLRLEGGAYFSLYFAAPAPGFL